MANSGYGKRPAGEEDPHADADFAHLLPRDAEIAVFLDHLDTGHSMSYKVLGAEHPRYGQGAMRTSLGRITDAGHLRWIKEHITADGGSMRWVTRTYWSRTRRSAEWWARFARERHGKDVTRDHGPGFARIEEQAGVEEPAVGADPAFGEEPADADGPASAPNAPAAVPNAPAAGPDEPEPAPEPAPGPEPKAEPVSAGYRALVGVRAVDARMALTEGDCRSLVPLAEEWLSRGATPKDLARALTEGLPPTVSNPGGFARRRLETKMPPQQREQRATVTRVIMACALCDQDERTVTIVRGVCEDCRKEVEADAMTDEDIVKGFEELAHLGTASAHFLRKKLERRTGGPVPDTFRPVPIEDRVLYHYRDNRDRIANGLRPRRWNP
jgi:hypothetical protein